MARPKYKKGTEFKNIHTGDEFIVTAVRLNCGFPFYYLRLCNYVGKAIRLKPDEMNLAQNYIELTPVAKVLYGSK